jgi:hypothetical protein
MTPAAIRILIYTVAIATPAVGAIMTSFALGTSLRAIADRVPESGGPMPSLVAFLIHMQPLPAWGAAAAAIVAALGILSVRTAKDESTALRRVLIISTGAWGILVFLLSAALITFLLPFFPITLQFDSPPANLNSR